MTRKKKAEEYKIPLDNVVSLNVNVNYLRHTPAVCACMECHENSHLLVSNTIIQPAELFLKVEKLISELRIPELIDHIKNVHQLKCKRAKNLVAAYILDFSIKYCTNAAEIQLSNGSLLVFQFSFDKIQFEDNQVHFLF